MIENFGVGIDIVEISRFKKLPYKEKESFYKKIFNPIEIEYCLKFHDPYRHFAAKFAIKEALKKSISKDIDFLDIITSYKDKKPIVMINQKLDYKFLVSVSHEKSYTIAIVISEAIV